MVTCDSYGDHHMHMCQRSQHTDTYTSTQKHTTTAHTHTRYNGWHMCMNIVFQCTYSLCMWCHTDTHIQAHRQHKTTPHIPYYVDACVCVCVLALLAHVHVMTRRIGVSQLVTSCVAVLTSPHHFQSHCRLSYHVELLHLHWVLSHNNINRTTMHSAASGNYLYCYQEQN